MTNKRAFALVHQQAQLLFLTKQAVKRYTNVWTQSEIKLRIKHFATVQTAPLEKKSVDIQQKKKKLRRKVIACPVPLVELNTR